jgi:hypothetical protein
MTQRVAARWKGALAAALLAALSVALIAFGAGTAHSQETDTGVAIDADSTGNAADSLGERDACVSVATGDTFDVDITVTDVVDLIAWEATFTYDPAVVTITARDVELFQAADGVSTVFDVSQSTPDGDGSWGTGAADTADPLAPDNGSGVLARITLEAVAAGTSELSLPEIDLNDDTVIDRGPNLRDVDGNAIGDEDDDGFFDGAVSDAQVVVDGPCTDSDGPPSEDGDDDDGGFPWLIAGIAAAGVAVAAGGGGFLAYQRSRRGRSVIP